MRIILESINELTKEQLVDKQLYLELMGVSDGLERYSLSLQIIERAELFRMKRNVENFIKLAEKERTKEERYLAAERSQNTVDTYTNFYPDKAGKEYPNMICGSWIAAEDGIYSSESNEAKQLVCHHPILPIKRLKNIETGEEQIILAYKRDGAWQEKTVPKTTIASARSITELAKYGVQVNSENAKLLVKYLSDVEIWNDDVVTLQRSTSKLGWRNGTFVPYDFVVAFDGETRFRSLYASVSESGDYAEWLSLMKELRMSGKKEPRIALAASFASVLLEPLGALPFIVDFHGQTEGGKTVTINIAASVWGNPKAGEYVGNFLTTDVALEAKADMLNNLPVILDDSKNASQKIKDNYETLIYNICAGKGKARSNKELGFAAEKTWSLVTITNGENPISEYSDSGGAINRIIEVECSENIYTDPAKVSSTVLRNYGFAGRVFVGYVKGKTKEELLEMKKEIESQFVGNDLMQKQILSMSMILLADKLATECIFMDGNELTVGEVRDLTAKRETVTEGQRCYNFLIDCPNMYPQHFDVTVNSDQWGIRGLPDEYGDRYLYFYVPALEEITRKNGFSRKAFTSWAMKRGLVKHNKDRDTYNMRFGLGDNKKIIKVIAVRIQEELSDNIEEEKENDNTNNDVFIPFS